jgi:hypothetical protein
MLTLKHKHHIIPKHAGGSDDPSNIIELTIEEHAEAHKILYEKYGRKQDWLAWQGLLGLMTKEEIIKEQLSMAGKKGGSSGKGITGNRSAGAKVNWEKNKEKILTTLRENGFKYGHLGGAKGDWIWINNGVDEKKILRDELIPDEWRKGRKPMKQESRDKIKESCKGINKGLIRSSEQREKMSEYRKGRSWYLNEATGATSQFRIDEVPGGWIKGRGVIKMPKRKK